jgi:hypothetical protein
MRTANPAIARIEREGEKMKIPASESTAIRKTVKCKQGHSFDAWYIRTPEGIVIETFGQEHRFLPKDRLEADYINGDCCFRAACDTGWELDLEM